MFWGSLSEFGNKACGRCYFLKKEKMFCFNRDVFASLKRRHCCPSSVWQLCSLLTHGVLVPLVWQVGVTAVPGAPSQRVPQKREVESRVHFGFCLTWGWGEPWAFRRNLGCYSAWDCCAEAPVTDTVHFWWLQLRFEHCWVSVHLGISIWHSAPSFLLLSRH